MPDEDDAPAQGVKLTKDEEEALGLLKNSQGQPVMLPDETAKTLRNLGLAVVAEDTDIHPRAGYSAYRYAAQDNDPTRNRAY